MGLHIEISGQLTRDEWTAVAAVAAIMLVETALTTGTVGAPALAAAGIGIDADRPTLPDGFVMQPNDAVPQELQDMAETVRVVVSPPPTASEALMASEAARVAVAPPPPPPAVAPPPPPSAPAGVELDVNGLPHDLRIHAASKTKTKDGAWRVRRGAEPALVTAVTAELRATMAVPVPPTGAAEAAPVHTDPAAAFGAGAPPPVEPAPSVTAPPPPPADDEGHPEFARIMRSVIELQAAKRLTTAQTTAIAATVGLKSVRDLQIRPDLIPAFEALLPK